MIVYKSIQEFLSWRATKKSGSIGFVPTMGALHPGHLSLIKNSKQLCQKTVVSIFINKLQFAPEEDFDNYPRTIDDDLKNLALLEVDVVLIPSSKEMYLRNFSFSVYESIISQKLEGLSRPGFFTGVTTVVSKLFNIVQPSHSFFGMKDIQQLVIIKNLVKDLNYNIQIIGCETVREKNGLAMSSRNQYLSKQEQEEASVLYQVLVVGKNLIKKKNTPCEIIKKKLKKTLQINKNITLDYLSIAHLNTFEELEGLIININKIVVSGAIYLNKVRLIDNVVINE